MEVEIIVIVTHIINIVMVTRCREINVTNAGLQFDMCECVCVIIMAEMAVILCGLATSNEGDAYGL